jgi:hypothetical protein
VSVDLVLQAGKDFVPDSHARSAIGEGLESSICWKTLLAANRTVSTLIISTTFPQMWKSLSVSKSMTERHLPDTKPKRAAILCQPFLPPTRYGAAACRVRMY